jgi:metal-responsive CopG/Arc/MetJ family transcriptional regulator
MPGNHSRVTVKIPRPLYERIQQVIVDSGFTSPTDFIVFVLRDLVGDRALKKSDPEADVGRNNFTNDELAEIRRKLENLGYL